MTKITVFVKRNVEEHEYLMHKYIYDLNIVNIPKIYDYDKKTKIMIMEDLNQLNIADMYGDDLLNNEEMFDNIRNIILKLYENGIIYVDITGYNFVETKKGLYILDCEHAYKVCNPKKYFKETTSPNVNFLKEFLFENKNVFNPYFE